MKNLFDQLLVGSSLGHIKTMPNVHLALAGLDEDELGFPRQTRAPVRRQLVANVIVDPKLCEYTAVILYPDLERRIHYPNDGPNHS